MSESTAPELNPEVMYAKVEEEKYKSEIEINERWQSFSAELLRLGLLGIAIFGFLYQQVFASFDPAKHPNVPIGVVKLLSMLSVAFFAFSTVCALVYRYGSTEAMAHYLMGLKNSREAESELRERDKWLERCFKFKKSSAFCLGVGALLSAIAIAILLL